MEKKMTAAICALAMLALTACGASVTEITLPESIELAPGESQQVEIAYTYDKEGLDEQARQKAVDAAAISWSVEGRQGGSAGERRGHRDGHDKAGPDGQLHRDRDAAHRGHRSAGEH